MELESLFYMCVKLHVILTTVHGYAPCQHTQEILNHGRKSYIGTILKTSDIMGLQMCLRACDVTGGCTHVNYNRRELKCDLMAGDADREPEELVTSGDMIFVTFVKDMEVSSPIFSTLIPLFI